MARLGRKLVLALFVFLGGVCTCLFGFATSTAAVILFSMGMSLCSQVRPLFPRACAKLLDGGDDSSWNGTEE